MRDEDELWAEGVQGACLYGSDMVLQTCDGPFEMPHFSSLVHMLGPPDGRRANTEAVLRRRPFWDPSVTTVMTDLHTSCSCSRNGLVTDLTSEPIPFFLGQYIWVVRIKWIYPIWCHQSRFWVGRCREVKPENSGWVVLDQRSMAVVKGRPGTSCLVGLSPGSTLRGSNVHFHVSGSECTTRSGLYAKQTSSTTELPTPLKDTKLEALEAVGGRQRLDQQGSRHVQTSSSLVQLLFAEQLGASSSILYGRNASW